MDGALGHESLALEASLAVPLCIALHVTAMPINNSWPQMPFANALLCAPHLRNDKLICEVWLEGRDPDMQQNQKPTIIERLPDPIHAMHEKSQMVTDPMERPELLSVMMPVEPDPPPFKRKLEVI